MNLVIADIPGLIEGASQGRGLGHRFLKHIERTRLLLYLLDITYRPDQDILEDFHIIRREMVSHSPVLAQKPQIVLINKIDLCGHETRDLKKLCRALESAGIEALSISALSGEGLEELKKYILEKWLKEKNSLLQ